MGILFNEYHTEHFSLTNNSLVKVRLLVVEGRVALVAAVATLFVCEARLRVVALLEVHTKLLRMLAKYLRGYL